MQHMNSNRCQGRNHLCNLQTDSTFLEALWIVSHLKPTIPIIYVMSYISFIQAKRVYDHSEFCFADIVNPIISNRDCYNGLILRDARFAKRACQI